MASGHGSNLYSCVFTSIYPLPGIKASCYTGPYVLFVLQNLWQFPSAVTLTLHLGPHICCLPHPYDLWLHWPTDQIKDKRQHLSNHVWCIDGGVHSCHLLACTASIFCFSGGEEVFFSWQLRSAHNCFVCSAALTGLYFPNPEDEACSVTKARPKWGKSQILSLKKMLLDVYFKKSVQVLMKGERACMKYGCWKFKTVVRINEHDVQRGVFDNKCLCQILWQI